ncbi:MAG: hypothetical protein ACI4WW_02730 [Candidatus Coprovivens sp.]
MKKVNNSGKAGKIVYEYEWGMFIPVCPFCKESVYEKDHCVFCKAKLEQPTEEEQEEVKKANHEYTVTYKNITLNQVANAVYEYRDNVLVSHWSLARPFTEEELLKEAKRLAGV